MFDDELLTRCEQVMREVCERRLRHEYVGRINRARTAGHVWAPSYFAASAGGAPLSIVQECIRGQKRPD